MMSNPLSKLAMLGAAMLLGACRQPEKNDLPLAAANADSVNRALADSRAPWESDSLARLAGAPRLTPISACENLAPSGDSVSANSAVVDMTLPAGFERTNEISPRRWAVAGPVVEWRGPAGWILASSHSDDPHAGWGFVPTSECDVTIDGIEAHLDLGTTMEGYGVFVLLKPGRLTAIGIEGEARTIEDQATLVHAIRSARVSAEWHGAPVPPTRVSLVLSKLPFMGPKDTSHIR